MTDDVKPCPFCGSTEIKMRLSSGDERTGYAEGFQIRCSTCGVSTAAVDYHPFAQHRRGESAPATSDEARAIVIAAWNRRTPR